MIHNVLITNQNGNILFSRHYDEAISADAKIDWEYQIHKLTHNDWRSASKYQEKFFVASYQNKHILFTGLGDLLIFWTGSDEYDELMLSEALSSFIAVLKQICKKGVNEIAIIETYHKLYICLDEMISRGVLDQVDPFQIKNFMDMKPDEVKKKA